MVRRIVLLLLLVGGMSWTASAQEFSTLDVSFGYGNYGVEDLSGGMLTSDRVHGFAMHTSINVLRWMGLENYTGAYSMKNDITLITNTFGVKLVARDVLEGRISPYLAGGFGFGYYTSNQTGGGFNTAAARYAVGVDLNMNNGMAIRIDVGNLAVGRGVFTDGWKSELNVTTGIVFNLGG